MFAYHRKKLDKNHGVNHTSVKHHSKLHIVIYHESQLQSHFFNTGKNIYFFKNLQILVFIFKLNITNIKLKMLDKTSMEHVLINLDTILNVTIRTIDCIYYKFRYLYIIL